jgi:sensor histidine kinase YesM
MTNPDLIIESPYKSTQLSLWLFCTWSFGLWMSIALLHGIAGNFEATANDQLKSPLLNLLQYALIFLPLALIHTVFALALWHKADWMLKAWVVLLNAVLLVALDLPLVTATKIIIVLWFASKPLSGFFDEWNKISSFILWVDICLILFVYLSQSAFAFWRRAKIKQMEMMSAQSASLELRLQLLQVQLNPHFLFNALNSISALVRGPDRSLAGIALKKLNGLLRYVVHSGKHEWVTIAEEMQFVRDYLAMQDLRFGERMTIDWQIQEQDWHNYSCPPLLLQPLVENAIHHGVEAHHEQCTIELKLFMEADELHFQLGNPKIAAAKKHKGHGVGLRATRERLELLYHRPDLLKVQESDAHFQLELKLPIA